MTPRPGSRCETTLDPTCWIVARGERWIVYENTDGERWVIWGTCNQCGACEVGGQTERTRRLIWTGEPGTPGVCHDPEYGTRPDLPTRPELRDHLPSCSLHGMYLRGR